MGGRAARFGAALSASLTQSVAENRRIKEQKLRDERLFTQTLRQITAQNDAIKDRQDAQFQRQQIEAQNAAKERDTFWRTVLGKDVDKVDGLINDQAGSAFLSKQTAEEKRQHERDVELQTQKLNVDLFSKLGDFFESDGLDTKEKTELASDASKIPDGLKTLKAMTDFIEGGDDTDTQFKQLIEAARLNKNAAGQLTSEGERFLNQALVVAGLVPPTENKETIFQDLLAGHNSIEDIKSANGSPLSPDKFDGIYGEGSYALLNDQFNLKNGNTVAVTSDAEEIDTTGLEKKTTAIIKGREANEKRQAAGENITQAKKFFTTQEQLVGSEDRAKLSDEDIASKILEKEGSFTTSGFELAGLAQPTSIIGRNRINNFLKSPDFEERKKAYIEGR